MFNNDKPNREFQCGLKADERRRLRQDERLALRRKDRENRLQRKRQALTNRNRTWDSNVNNNPNVINGSSGLTYGNSHSRNHDAQRRNEMIKQLPQYVQGCFNNHPATQFECCQRIRKLLSIERNPPIKQVIDSGVVPRLVQFLKLNEFEKLQFEAAWALTNIASGSAEHTAHVIRNGAVPLFINLLSSSSYEVREQAIWALGNISGDSPECRNLVLDNGVLTNLLPICHTKHNTLNELNLLRNCTWTLSNFCRGKPSPSWKYIKLILSALSILLMSDDDEILQDACWGFSYLSDIDDCNNDDPRFTNIVNCGALNKLITLLDHSSVNVRHPALRTIGNIVTGCDKQTQCVINLGVLKKLSDLMKNDKKCIQREACWTISNITAGSRDQIESVISSNLFQPLIYLLSNSHYDVSCEALWAISNATSGGSQTQIKFLVNQGVIAPLCKFLKNYQSKKILMVTLEGIENILQCGKQMKCTKFANFIEESNGVDYLEQIIANDKIPDEIYEKAASILKEYWDGEEAANNNNNINTNHFITPNINQQQQQFSFGFNNNNNNMSNINNMNNNSNNNTYSF